MLMFAFGRRFVGLFLALAVVMLLGGFASAAGCRRPAAVQQIQVKVQNQGAHGHVQKVQKTTVTTTQFQTQTAVTATTVQTTSVATPTSVTTTIIK